MMHVFITLEVKWLYLNQCFPRALEMNDIFTTLRVMWFHQTRHFLQILDMKYISMTLEGKMNLHKLECMYRQFDEIARWLMFLLPSRYNGSPNSVLSSYSRGKYVFTTLQRKNTSCPSFTQTYVSHSLEMINVYNRLEVKWFHQTQYVHGITRWLTFLLSPSK